MLATIAFKGSASSGWYAPPKGTHSGEKHRAVGSGKSTLKVRLVGRKATRHEGKHGLVYYSSKDGAQMPSDVVNMEFGVVLYHPIARSMYAANHEIAGELELFGHEQVYEAAGLSVSGFDEWVRPWFEDGVLNFSFEQSGVAPARGAKYPDVNLAERKVVQTAKAMARAGFRLDTRVSWEYDKGVWLDLKLGDM